MNVFNEVSKSLKRRLIENSKGFNYGVGYTFEFGKNMKDSKITLGLGYKF